MTNCSKKVNQKAELQSESSGTAEAFNSVSFLDEKY